MKRRYRRRQDPLGKRLGSLLFKLGSRLLLAVMVIITFLTLTRCSVRKPEAPRWDTHLVVPVLNRTYPMAELIEKIGQEGLGIDSAGAVTYSLSKDLDTVRLDQDLLSTSDISRRYSEHLGIITLDPPLVDPVTVSLSSITGLGSGLPGDSAVVGPAGFDLYNDMPDITIFSQATVVAAQVEVVIDNNLGVDLDTSIVLIYDEVFASVVAVDTFAGGIPAGQVSSLPISLNGQTISGSLRVDSHCHTPGGAVDSVSQRSISTDLVFSTGIDVSSAVAEVPPLSRNYSEPVPLNESDPIDSATIASGLLSLSIDNTTGIDADVVIAIPDLRDSSGQPFSFSRNLEAYTNTSTNLNLTGHRLTPLDLTVPQDLAIDLSASTPGSGPVQVVISQNDSFVVQANLTNLQFSSVSGVFDSAGAGISGIGQDTDLPTGFDSVQFVSAVLQLNIQNAVDLPGSLDLTLLGSNGKTMNLAGAILPGSPSAPVLTIISDGAAGDFLSPPPDHFDVSGSAYLGDGVYQSTVGADDYLFANLSIYAPLEIIINESRIETDIEREHINQTDIDLITDHVIEGSFYYNIVNHLPLGAMVNVFFGADSAALFANPIKRIDSLSVTAAPVSADGLVSDTVSTGYRVVAIDSADLRRVLENDTLFVGQEVFLDGSGGQPVRFTANDYVSITGRFEVTYRFDGEL